MAAESKDLLDHQREVIAAALPPKLRASFDEWLLDWTETHIQIARQADFIASFGPPPVTQIPF